MYYNPSASFFQIHYVLFIAFSSSVDFLHAKDFCEGRGFLNLVRYLMNSRHAEKETQGLSSHGRSNKWSVKKKKKKK